jgi:hypothetical protein
VIPQRIAEGRDGRRSATGPAGRLPAGMNAD